MGNELGERRKGRVISLFLMAGAAAAIAAVTVGIESRSSRPDRAAGPVLPGLEQTISGAQRVTVTTAGEIYHIVQTQRGWAMADRDDYPVARGRLEQLTSGLASLRYTRRMTSDASKHARLGVGDPREGGRGVLVQIEDGRGALLVSLILGVETGGLYVRRPDEDQTWAAAGDLPPLRDAAAWLDMKPLEIGAEQIARVEIAPPEGRGYVLARDGAEQPWRIDSPALAATSQEQLAATAAALTRAAPTDVRSAPAIQGAARARVRATTFAGVTIDAELILSDGAPWLKLVAREALAEPTEAQTAAALAINNRASAWAYRLSEMDSGALAPPLGALIGAAPPIGATPIGSAPSPTPQ